MESPYVFGSSSGCICGGFCRSGVEVGDEVPADAVRVDELADLELLRELRVRVVLRGVVASPARRLVGQPERAEQVVVEAVLTDEQLVHVLEVRARLRALDDTVVVGRGERDDLADAEVGDGARVGGLELGGQVDGADPEDRGLARHQARHRVDGPDRAGVGDRQRRTDEHRRVEVVGADAAHDRLVGGDEAGEVERRRALDDGDEERAAAVRGRHVDGEAEPDRAALEDRGLAVDLGVAARHRRHDRRARAPSRTRSGG